MKNFSLICAVSLNGVIGESESNTIPWYLPVDLKHFKAHTLNKTCVMGSRTYHSIGKPLKDRRNVVITRNPSDAILLKAEGVDETYPSFTDTLKHERDGFIVCGGQHIYGEALRARPTRMIITVVLEEFEGDVQFPIIGSRFLNDEFVMQNGDRYICDTRSGILEDNGIKFQFTDFSLI